MPPDATYRPLPTQPFNTVKANDEAAKSAVLRRQQDQRIQRREIDPSFVITHRMALERAPEGYDTFLKKKEGCEKVVLSPWS